MNNLKYILLFSSISLSVKNWLKNTMNVRKIQNHRSCIFNVQMFWREISRLKYAAKLEVVVTPLKQAYLQDS